MKPSGRWAGTKRRVFIPVVWMCWRPVTSSPGMRIKSGRLSAGSGTLSGSIKILCSLRIRKL